MFSVLMSLSRPESESCCRVLAQPVFRSGGELATNVIQGGGIRRSSPRLGLRQFHSNRSDSVDGILRAHQLFDETAASAVFVWRFGYGLGGRLVC